ncbi:MAG TPA: NAD(P)/FAD-dependent oxidoreductase, partial [Gemmatimonadaceae bacterium]
GGPAGSSAGYFLAKAGMEVTLIDRAHFPRDKTCSEYLSPQASRILAAMNVLDAVESTGAAQLAGMRVHAPNGATIKGNFKGDHGFRGFRDRGLAVRRTVLDAMLLERAKQAGVTVREGVRATDIIRDASGPVRGIKGIDEAGQQISIQSDLVIGADGLRSVISRRLGLIKPARWPKRIALVAHYAGVAHDGAYGDMYVDRGGYCGIAYLGNKVTNVAVVIPVSRAAEVAVDRTEFLESWIAERPRLAERFTNATRIDPVRATGPFATSAKRAAVEGAALVGDAADFFDPFTGEGIYTALRGGELLASLVADPLRGNQPTNNALREYDRARRKEFSGKWTVEKLVGAAVALPPMINRAANVLSRRRDMADLLVGVAGDFVPAGEVLRPGYLLNLLFAPPGRA